MKLASWWSPSQSSCRACTDRAGPAQATPLTHVWTLRCSREGPAVRVLFQCSCSLKHSPQRERLRNGFQTEPSGRGWMDEVSDWKPSKVSLCCSGKNQDRPNKPKRTNMLLSWAHPAQATHVVEFPPHSRFAPQGQEGKRTAQTSMALPKGMERNFNCKAQPEVPSVQIPSCLSFPFDRGAHFLG